MKKSFEQEMWESWTRSPRYRAKKAFEDRYGDPDFADAFTRKPAQLRLQGGTLLPATIVEVDYELVEQRLSARRAAFLKAISTT